MLAAMPDDTTNSPMPPKVVKKAISFDYEKGTHYRMIHVDGAHGGLSPDGEFIIMSVFSERRPIPTREVFQVNERAEIDNDHPDRTTRDVDVFREVEASLIMNEATAQAMLEWLKKYLATFRTTRAKRDAFIAHRDRKPTDKPTE